MVATKKVIYKCISRNGRYKGYHFKYHETHLEGEEWKFHPNGYRVSNMGRTCGKRRGITKGSHRSSGYMVIYDGNKMYQVHRLVLESFTSVDEGINKFVDHIDGDRTNNRLDNLRWVTAKENAQNRKKRGVFKHCNSCTCNLE